MQTIVMMRCGHAANATRDGKPCCAICPTQNAFVVVDVEWDKLLDGRRARCYCGKTMESDLSLAFFEYRGNGSRHALDTCKNCRYAEVAHTQPNTRTQKNVVERGECSGFVPIGGHEFDSFYCGCRGWD